MNLGMRIEYFLREDGRSQIFYIITGHGILAHGSREACPGQKNYNLMP